MKLGKRCIKMEKSIYSVLSEVDVSEHIENKGKLSYLSWAWAFDELFKKYPKAQYEVKKFDGKPYLYDEKTGYMVFTSVTIHGQTKEMWLPVINHDYKAMKDKPYEYQIRRKGEYSKKTCEAADMFEINKTIMRCLVKNLAMFGLGMSVYRGEDLPDEESAPVTKKNELPDDENTAKIISMVVEKRNRLNELGTDVLNPKTNKWILDNTKIKTQDLGAIKSTKDLLLLNSAYATLIRVKEAKQHE